MGSAKKTVYEEDTILLYCKEAKGYLYIQIQRIDFNVVSVCQTEEEQPKFENVHCAVFRLHPAVFCSEPNKHSASPMDRTKPELQTATPSSQQRNKEKRVVKPLVYGRIFKLEHLATGKFLCIPKCDDEAANLVEEKDASLLRMIPPKGAKNWGQEVCCDDVIKLESAMHRGHRIHCVHRPNMDGYCLLYGITGSSFCVKTHCNKLCESDPNAVKGGNVVMLFSLRTDEGYLEMSDVNPLHKDKGSRLVGCQKHKQQNGLLLPAAMNSCTTFLQFEKETSPFNGEAIKFGELCRIKHSSTQAYLTTDDNNEVILQEDRSDKGVFILLSVEEDANNEHHYVTWQSKILLQQVSGGAKKLLSVKAKPRHTGSTSEVSLHDWYYATMVDDSISSRASHSCEFRIDMVDHIVVQDVYLALGVSSFLYKKLSGKHWIGAKESLEGLSNWLKPVDQRRFRTETLLRLNILDHLFSSLGNTSDNQFTEMVCEVLCKLMAEASQETRQYLDRKPNVIDKLLQKVGQDVKAEMVLITLAKNSPTLSDMIVGKAFPQDTLTHFDASKLVILELFGTLAFHGSRPNTVLHKQIVQETLEAKAIEDFAISKECLAVLHAFSDFSRSSHNERKAVHATHYSYAFDYDELNSGLSQSRVTGTFDMEVNNKIMAFMSQVAKKTDLLCDGTFESQVKNVEIIEVLLMFRTLMDCGRTEETRIAEMMSSMVILLNGLASKSTSDTHGGSKLCGGKETPEQNRFTIVTKTVIIYILKLLMKQHLYAALKLLLFDFKYLSSEFERPLLHSQDSTEAGMRDSHNQIELVDFGVRDGHDRYNYTEPQPVMKDLMKLEPGLQLSKTLVTAVRSRLERNFGQVAYSMLNITSSKARDSKLLLSTLLNLLDEENDQLCINSAELLFTLHSVESMMLADAKQSYILTSELMNDTVTELKELGTFTDEDCLLVEMLKGATNDSIVSKLSNLAARCESDKDETEPNALIQGVAYSSGVFSVLLEYVLQYGTYGEERHEKVLDKCFILLRKITRKNINVQRRIFDCFHDLLDVKRSILFMSELLCEVFSGNPELCKEVTERDMRQLFDTAISSNNQEHAHLLMVIRAIIKNVDPRTPVQEQVAYLFQEYWQSTLSEGLHNKRDYRIRLLETYDDEHGDLLLLLNTCDLLGTCTEGECKVSEAVSKKFYDISEILSILENDKISMERKLPFARILAWTYLNTDGDSSQACGKLLENKLFWQHLETLANLIRTNLLQTIQKLNSTQKDVVTQKLKCLSEYFLSVPRWMQMTRDDVLAKSINDKKLTFGQAIFYVTEAYLPLVTAFFNECFNHMSERRERMESHGTFTFSSENITVLKEIFKALLDLERSGIFTVEQQMESLCDCTVCVKKVMEDIGIADVDEELPSDARLRESRQHSFVETMQSSSVKEDHNKELQRFVSNYWIAYIERSPTKEDQMYIERWKLPQGPSFEKLVEFFTDTEDDIRSGKPLKIEKLLVLLDHLLKKHRQHVHSLEQSNLDWMTALSLRILHSVIDNHREQKGARRFQRKQEKVFDIIQQRMLHCGTAEKLINLLLYTREDVAYHVLKCLNVLHYHGRERSEDKLHTLKHNNHLLLRIHQILQGIHWNLTYTWMDSALEEITEDSLYPEERTIQSMIRQRKQSIPRKGSISVRRGSLLRRNTTSSIVMETIQDQQALNIKSSKEETMDEQCTLYEQPVTTLYLPSVEPKRATNVDKQIIAVLDVISHLCDGQERHMQDILREHKSFKGASVISQVAFLFHGIVNHYIELTDDDVEIAEHAAQSLIEMCAGNYSNQEVAVNGQVITSINHLLGLNDQSLVRLKCSCIEILEMILEKTDERSDTLVYSVISELDIHNVLQCMYQLWTHAETKDQTLTMKGRFRAYHLLKRIADYQTIDVNSLVGLEDKKRGNLIRGTEDENAFHSFDQLFQSHREDAYKMWKDCTEWSKSVEVVYRGKNTKSSGLLNKVYFPYDPNKHLSESVKEKVMYNIKRDTQEEKLTDLLQWIKAISVKYKRKRQLTKNLFMKFLFRGSLFIHILLFCLTVIINLFVLFLFAIPPPTGSTIGENETNFSNFQFIFNSAYPSSASGEIETKFTNFEFIFNPNYPSWFNYVHYILGGIYSLLSIWMAFQYFVKNKPHFSMKISFLHQWLYDIKRGILRRKWLYYIFKNCSWMKIERPKKEMYFEIPIFGWGTLYRVLFVICSVLGLAYPYFYCLCTIYLFINNKDLHNVVRAISHGGKQLIIIGATGLVFLYIYSVVSFAFFQNYFTIENGLFCNSIFQCYITVMRFGLLGSLDNSIPLRLSADVEADFDVLLVRTIFDLTFFVIITLLGINIIIAILVDNFSSLRAQKEKIDEDHENVCFICGIKKGDFDRCGLNFYKHQTKEHYMWNYIYFALYLENVHPNDHNALEKYVYDKLPKGSDAGMIDFFPLRCAKSLLDHKHDKMVEESSLLESQPEFLD